MRNRNCSTARGLLARCVIAAMVVSLACFSAIHCGRASHTSHPAAGYNVLLVSLDTVRADHIGAYGGRTASTPALDALAQGGTRFDAAMSAVPLTLPSHATILAGLFPNHHGLRNNGAGIFPAGRETLATMFARAGYRTGAFVGSFVLDHRFGLNRGFEVYDDAIPRAADTEDVAGVEAERPANIVIDRALAWLGRDDPRPFFAWVHLYDAHAPYAAPEPFRSRYRDHPYDGEIAWVDSQLGRLTADLQRRGLAERTMIVVVGDHGESLGEHGELTHGLLLYEPTLRVPVVWSAPSAIRTSVVKVPVSLADVAPTIATLTGLTLTSKNDPLDGADLSSSLIGGREPATRDIYAETEYPTVFGWEDLFAIRNGAMKYIASSNPELYDLSRDPSERSNLRDSQRRVSHDLSLRLSEIRKGSVEVRSSALDPETAAKLASLGYVSRSAPSVVSSSRNPADVIGLFRQFEEATWSMKAGRVAEARELFERLHREDPSNAVFTGAYARALRQEGDLTQSIALYRDAVASSPADGDGWYNLGVAFQEAGQSRESIAALNEAVRRNERSPEFHNALGISYATLGRPTEALSEFERAIAIDPQNGRAWNNSANIYRSENRLDQAEKAYLEAIKVAPSYADPLNGLGVLEVQRNRPAEALQFFDRALKLSPGFHEVLLNRGIALEVMGDLDGAADQYRDFLKIAGRDRGLAEQRKAATDLLARLNRGRRSPSRQGR